MTEGQKSAVEDMADLQAETVTYDRVIAIIGTDSGYIKLWDLTYFTDQKELRRRTDNALKSLGKGLARSILLRKQQSLDFQRQ